MKKIRLDPEALKVESFDVADSPADRGTVHGRETQVDDFCQPSPIDGCMASYDVPCRWTGDPMQDCFAPSAVAPCSDYPAYC
jgi:hypothetical protein